MEIIVKAIIPFNDMESKTRRTPGERFVVSQERANVLVEHKVAEIIEEVKKSEKTETVFEEPKTEKVTDEIIEKYSKFVEEKPKKKKAK